MDNRPCRRLARLAFTAGAVGFGITAGAVLSSSPSAVAVTCVDGAADLTDTFAQAPDGLAGADYQRAIDLPDGRRLWTFQDAYVHRPDRSDALVHNVAVVQDGGCFDLLHGGTPDDPTSWLAADATVPFEHWFWPLAATIPGDGTVRIFLAELEERGPRYLANATPLATWVATVDATTLAPVAFGPAPDPGPALYGWSVASDTHFTYLYGHCYRQFGFGFLGHDDCTSAVTVARTTHDLQRPLQYWDGTRWLRRPEHVGQHRAEAGTRRDPSQHQPDPVRPHRRTLDRRYQRRRLVGIEDLPDTAPGPTGPWTTTAALDATAPDPDENTYFASIVTANDGNGHVVVGLSHNRWDGDRTSHYRPTFQTVPLNRWDQPTANAAAYANVRYR